MKLNHPTLAPTLAVAVVVLAGAVACTSGGAAQSPPPAQFKAQMRIGVMSDIPGIGLLAEDGRYRGFDIELADWLGLELGFDVLKVHVNVKDRESWLEQDKIDLVIGAYSITDARAQRIDFAGPYMRDRQGIVYRDGDPPITSPEQIADKRFCTIEGSTSAEQLRDWRAVVETEPLAKTCIEGIFAGKYRAASTDKLILAGFAKQDPRLKLSGFVFGVEERYGVGMRKGNEAWCQAITDKLRKFINSGDWSDFFRDNFTADLSRGDHKPEGDGLRKCARTKP